jgi:hypothetical protein
MIDGLGDGTKITSFDMCCPNLDDDLVKKVCLSILEWANYLLEPYEDIENKDKIRLMRTYAVIQHNRWCCKVEKQDTK